MTSVGEDAARTAGERADTARLEAFSDGVFAIAITLLVLELHGPPDGRPLSHWLVDEWPQFAAYLSSFFIIGIMWANHHSMFRQIRRLDRPLLFLNLLLLLWTALLPFPTLLIARYLGESGNDAKVAEAVYAANLTLAAIAFSLIWTYAVRHRRLIDHDLTPEQEWASIARFSAGTFVYAATIGVAFLSPELALALQFLLALYYLFEQLRS